MPDPILQWSFKTTGYGDIHPIDVAMSTGGSSFITGSYGGTPPPSKIFGTIGTVNSTGTDAYICKLQPDGTVSWLFNITGLQDSQMFGVVPDGSGGCYSIGWCFGGTANYPCTLNGGDGSSILVDAHVGSAQYTYNPNPTNYAFGCFLIIHLDSTGAIVWYRMFGGHTYSASCYGVGIGIDPGSGNLLICGVANADMDFGGSAGIIPISAGNNGLAIAKLDKTTGLGIWAKSSPVGNVSWTPLHIAVTSAGDMVVSAAFLGGASGPFDLGGGNVARTGEAGYGNFLVKYSGTDGHWIWDHTFAASSPGGIVIDPVSGLIVACGYAGGSSGSPAIPMIFKGGGTYYSGVASVAAYAVAYDSSGVHAWEYVINNQGNGGTGGVGFNSMSLASSVLYIGGLVNGFMNWGGSIGTPPTLSRGSFLLACNFSTTQPPFATFLQADGISGNYTSSLNTAVGKIMTYGWDGSAGYQAVLKQWSTNVISPPNPADFTAVYAPSSDGTVFQTKFGFALGPNFALPSGVSNVLIKYLFPTNTIFPTPNVETTPFLLLNYRWAAGDSFWNIGPVYGFVYKVSSGNGALINAGLGYYAIGSWYWTAAWADSTGARISDWCSDGNTCQPGWVRVVKTTPQNPPDACAVSASAVLTKSDGNIVNNPFANLKTTTLQTARGPMQFVS